MSGFRFHRVSGLSHLELRHGRGKDPDIVISKFTVSWGRREPGTCSRRREHGKRLMISLTFDSCCIEVKGKRILGKGSLNGVVRLLCVIVVLYMIGCIFLIELHPRKLDYFGVC